MKAPQQLVDIMRNVPKENRKAAIKFADEYFHDYLDKLNSFDDFSTKINYELAIMATVSEIIYKFQK